MSDEVDENVYKRSQQDKWTRQRKGDEREDGQKRFKREHKVQ